MKERKLTFPYNGTRPLAAIEHKTAQLWCQITKFIVQQVNSPRVAQLTWFDKGEIVVPVLAAIYALLTYFPADTAKELVTSQDFSVVNKNHYAIFWATVSKKPSQQRPCQYLFFSS